jgi:hypothetical protein
MQEKFFPSYFLFVCENEQIFLILEKVADFNLLWTSPMSIKKLKSSASMLPKITVPRAHYQISSKLYNCFNNITFASLINILSSFSL